MEAHFEGLLRLVELEAAAQAERTQAALERLTPDQAERAGLSILDLVVADEHAGLGGRVILELRRRTEGAELPWSRIDVGSPVILAGLRGVVTERDRRRLLVAFSSVDEEPEAPLRLDLSSDEITAEREKRALRTAENAAPRFVELFAGRAEPRFDPEAPIVDVDLDDTQKEAIAFALTAHDVALIHGPPGTGKTRTAAALIGAAVARGDKVLACAPSNIAVDNLLERLVALGLDAVRLGHPARISKGLVDRSLDLLVERHESVRLARKLVKEAWALRRQADRFTRSKPPPGHKKELRAEARRLLADARRFEREATEQILDGADVVCATTSLDTELLGGRRFDLLVLDEACQCTEPSAWIPLRLAETVVLAGDHQQLPPTVISEAALRGGLAKSLFEQILDRYGPSVSRRLGVQYRMHRHIMGFSNDRFYEGTLEADASVADHTLQDLPPLSFVDTAGSGWQEAVEPDGESRLNEGEAELVAKKVTELLERGVPRDTLGVITPYAAQVRLLRSLIEDVEVHTVDGFQGREKDAILISLVRSNWDGDIGFLADLRRMNVALTRARKHLVVIGDSATVGAHPFYAAMIEYFEAHGAYGTVWD